MERIAQAAQPGFVVVLGRQHLEQVVRRATLDELVGDDPARSRRMVMLEVRDSGAGIDPAVLPRIFEPFFSTKARHEGSGLGLAIVKHVVELAGGRVEVESTPGQGATFRVLLPRVAG